MRLSIVLPFLVPVAICLPTSSSADTETWTVTRLDYHYMTAWPGFGPPHMPWPPESYFNSTISLDVQIPNGSRANWTVTCETSWPNGTLPTGGFGCLAKGTKEDLEGLGSVESRIESYLSDDAPPEMPFRLSVSRALADGSSFSGSVNVSSDNSTAPTSYLTCMATAPLDGMRCKLHWLNNINLSNGQEMRIVAQKN
ncbi:hypothetical protein N0V90_005465 [Kalmusia sp. IMI 367209]|nr:hypothetical protein N0V90_005465 [Kalmusia sp. IMI 367209]